MVSICKNLFSDGQAKGLKKKGRANVQCSIYRYLALVLMGMLGSCKFILLFLILLRQISDKYIMISVDSLFEKKFVILRYLYLLLPFQYLYLEGNELTSLPDDFFDCLPKLTWLDLRSNKLLRLPSVYTGRHNHLRTLLLEDNKLRSLPLELGNGFCTSNIKNL